MSVFLGIATKTKVHIFCEVVTTVERHHSIFYM
jgi:hypothetical protein